MLFRSPSSLPISARVVAVKPLRAKHLAAAERMEATRGFSQSAARCCDAPFSSGGLRGLLTTGSVVFMFFQCTGQPVSLGQDVSNSAYRPRSRGSSRRSRFESSPRSGSSSFGLFPFLLQRLGLPARAGFLVRGLALPRTPIGHSGLLRPARRSIFSWFARFPHHAASIGSVVVLLSVLIRLRRVEL